MLLLIAGRGLMLTLNFTLLLYYWICNINRTFNNKTLCFLNQLYSSESASEPDVDLENQYYNSKALKEDNPKAALDSFKKVLELEQEKGEWGFRALKQMIKINFKLVSVVANDPDFLLLMIKS